MSSYIIIYFIHFIIFITHFITFPKHYFPHFIDAVRTSKVNLVEGITESEL